MQDTVIVAATMMLMEFLSIAITAISYIIYKKKEKYNSSEIRQRRGIFRKSYKVSENYQKSENRNVFFLMLPWMVAHFLTNIIFYGLVLAVPMFFDWQDGIMEMRVAVGYSNVSLGILLIKKKKCLDYSLLFYNITFTDSLYPQKTEEEPYLGHPNPHQAGHLLPELYRQLRMDLNPLYSIRTPCLPSINLIFILTNSISIETHHEK